MAACTQSTAALIDYVAPADFSRRYVQFVGDEREFLGRGILREGNKLPKAPCGSCEREGVKVAMLRDGRLRVTLAAEVSAQRDRALQTLLGRVSVTPASRSSLVARSRRAVRRRLLM